MLKAICLLAIVAGLAAACKAPPSQQLVFKAVQVQQAPQDQPAPEGITLTVSEVEVVGPSINLSGGAVAVSPAPAEDGSFPVGTNVTLIAASNPDFDFLGWEGDCEGRDPRCLLVMDSGKAAEAVFIKPPTVGINGAPVTGGVITLPDGKVTLSPPPDPATGRYRAGTKVSVSAYPEPGHALSTWSGDCVSQQGDCVLTMDGEKSLSVSFADVRVTINGQTLSGATVNVPNGLVRASLAPDVAGGLYALGASLTLTAEASSGFAFDAWTGPCAGQGAVCQFTVDGPEQLTVAFKAG